MHFSCKYVPVMGYIIRITVFTGLVLFASSIVFAQTGTIGGSLGKTNKSVSGSVKKRVSLPKVKTSTLNRKSVEKNYAGTWRWTEHCPSTGKWTGTFKLSGTAGNLQGSFKLDQRGDDGIFLGGVASSNKIVFRRRKTTAGITYTQTWDGVLSKSGSTQILSGSVKNLIGSCSFTARK